MRNAFGSNISMDIKVNKAQYSKILHAGGFLGALLEKVAVPVMKFVFLW